MATEKEMLLQEADELGLETEGATVAQLKGMIAEAKDEDGTAPAEPTPEVVAEKPAAPAEPKGDLPPPPVNPVAKKPKKVAAGAIATYEVKSSFWLQTSEGPALAQVGGTVKLTQSQAKKYLRHGNIVEAA